jgi:hypothetical protein
MSDWKIEVIKADREVPLLAEVLIAQQIWKRLSKASRAAVEHGYKHGLVDAHGNTMAALERHGFMHSDCRLTEAGKRVAKWNVKP